MTEQLQTKNRGLKRIAHNVGWTAWALTTAAIPTTIAVASIQNTHHSEKLARELVVAAADDDFAASNVRADLDSVSTAPRYADLQVEPDCVLKGVRLHYVEKGGNIGDITSYSITQYVGATLIPASQIGLHNGGMAITGQQVTLNFANKGDLEANILKDTPCHTLADTIAYQQSLPNAQ